MPPNPPSKSRRKAPRNTSRKRDVYFSPILSPPHVWTWIYALGDIMSTNCLQVCIGDVLDEDGAAAVKEFSQTFKGKVIFVNCDVTRLEDIKGKL